MSTTTTTSCKYIAIGIQIFIIIISLLILISIYIYSNNHLLDDGDFHNYHSTITTNNLNDYQSFNIGDNNRTVVSTTSANDYHRSYAIGGDGGGNLINWIGQSIIISNDQQEEIPSSSSSIFFIAGRPLIVTCFLAYVLAILGSVAIGLEHQTLLLLLTIVFAAIFICSLTVLVFSFLTTITLTIDGDSSSDSNFRLNFWNSLLILIVSISGLEVCDF